MIPSRGHVHDRGSAPARPLLRTALIPPLMALLLGASVLVPVLDRGLWAAGETVESRHDPASCPRGHDHTVCTQVVANAWAAASASDVPLPPKPVARHATPDRRDPAGGSPSGIHHARAPPVP